MKKLVLIGTLAAILVAVIFTPQTWAQQVGEDYDLARFHDETPIVLGESEFSEIPLSRVGLWEVVEVDDQECLSERMLKIEILSGDGLTTITRRIAARFRRSAFDYDQERLKEENLDLFKGTITPGHELVCLPYEWVEEPPDLAFLLEVVQAWKNNPYDWSLVDRVVVQWAGAFGFIFLLFQALLFHLFLKWYKKREERRFSKGLTALEDRLPKDLEDIERTVAEIENHLRDTSDYSASTDGFSEHLDT